MIRCRKCGGENRDEAKFCRHCREPLREVEETEAEGEVTEVGEIAQLPLGEVEHEAAKRVVLEVTSEPSGELIEAREEEVGVGVGEVEYAPLPEGALVNERKYELRELLGEVEGLSIYKALSIEQLKQCPQCGNLAGFEDNFCWDCGVSVEDVPSGRVTFTAIEVPKARKTMLIELAEMCKGCGDILPQVVDEFDWEPYSGSERSYIILKRYEGLKLDELDASTMRLRAVLEIALKLLKLVELLSRYSYHVPELTRRVIVKDGGITFGELEALQKAASCEDAASDMSMQVRVWLIEALQRFCDAKPSLIELRIAQELMRGIEAIERVKCVDEMRSRIEAALNELVGAVAIEYRGFGATDIGKVRELNEDGFVVWELTGFQDPRPFRIGLYAVADGMGGHQAGEVACKLALNALLETIQKAVLNELGKGVDQLYEADWRNTLRSAFEHANRVVWENALGSRSDMGTTMVAALVIGNRAYIANVGDSRAYIFRGDKLKQITKDHSLVQQLVDAGQIQPEQARVHPHRNIIYRAVGLREQIEVDLFEELLSVGDKLLLCSDGLHDMVEDKAIEEVLLSEQDLQSSCAKLIEQANELGGADNITVVLVEMRGTVGAN